MGQIDKLLITFNENGKFKPGKHVSGSVNLETKKSLDIYSITAEIRGHAESKWSTSGGVWTRNKYGASEEYCRQELLLWGSAQSATQSQSSSHHKLPAGVHERYFVFELPSNCPASFYGSSGQISYSVTVTCQMKGFWSRKVEKYEKYFHVDDPVDLSLEPSVHELCEPVEIRSHFKKESCLPCKRRSCLYEIITEKRAFVPGEEMIINGRITNHSSRRLHFFFALKRQTTYTGRRQGGCFSMLTSSGNPKEFVSRELIETWKAPVIEPRAHQTPLVTPLLVVPTDHHDDCHNVSSLLPSGLRGCSFIDIKYTMEITACWSGLFKSKIYRVGEFPIVIGSRIHQPSGAAEVATITTTATTVTSQQPQQHQQQQHQQHQQQQVESYDLPPSFEVLEPTAPPYEQNDLGGNGHVVDVNTYGEAPPKYEDIC